MNEPVTKPRTKEIVKPNPFIPKIEPETIPKA